MTDLILVALKAVLVIAISVGSLATLIVLVMTIDMLHQEWVLFAEKWRTPREIPEPIVRHRQQVTVRHVPRHSADEEEWYDYFVKTLAPNNVAKNAAFVHPYIAARPKLHRFTIRMEPAHA